MNKKKKKLTPYCSLSNYINVKIFLGDEQLAEKCMKLRDQV